MDISIWKEERKRRTERLGGVLLIAIALFYAVVCTPVYLWTSSDILVASSIFPAVWDMVMYFMQYLFYWVAFAFFIYIAARYTLKGSIPYLVWYASCAAARYVANLTAAYIMVAGSSGWEDIRTDIFYMLIDILGDLVQMALVVLIFWLLLERKRSPKDSRTLRLQKLFAFSEPLLRCMLFAVLIPSVIRLLSRVYYDIFFGGPQSFVDLLSMIFYYAMDLLGVLLGYLAVFLIINQLNLKDTEAELNVTKNIQSGHL